MNDPARPSPRLGAPAAPRPPARLGLDARRVCGADGAGLLAEMLPAMVAELGGLVAAEGGLWN